jgi:hypothetical protein
VLAGGEVLVKRAYGWLVLAFLWAHQVAIAFLAPLVGDDWAARIDGPSATRTGELYHALVVGSRLAHVIVTPLVVASLAPALAILARGRLRLRERDDVMLLAVIASLLWLAVPHFGLACAMRSAVAIQIVTATVAAWYVVAFRAAARGGTPAWAWAALAAGGVIAGDTTRPIAAAVLVVCGAIAWRARSWRALPALAGVAIGGVIAALPDLGPALAALATRGLDGNLRELDARLRVPAWAGVAVLAIWIGRLVWLRGRGRAGRPLPDDDLALMLRAAALTVGAAAVALASADLTLLQLVAPSLPAVIALAVPVAHLARGRGVIALGVAAIAVQAWAVGLSMRALVPAHRDFDERVAALEAAAPGSIATVPPYHEHKVNPWSAGEDFRTSELRDRVATRVFGLRGIALEPRVLGAQPVPPLVLHHELDGGDPDAMPRFYSADLATAREQFAAGVRRARPRRAVLVADGVRVPGAPAPIWAAWADDGAARGWSAWADGIDRQGRLRIIPPPGPVTAMWSVDLERGVAAPLPRDDDGRYRLQPGRPRTAALIACTIDRCALAQVLSLY